MQLKTPVKIRPIKSRRLFFLRRLFRNIRQRSPATRRICPKILTDAVTSTMKVPRAAGAPPRPPQRPKRRSAPAQDYFPPPPKSPPPLLPPTPPRHPPLSPPSPLTP